jgi:hypothetical protein
MQDRDTLSRDLSAEASARGWPLVRYRAQLSPLIDPVVQKNTSAILSTIAPDSEPTVTVCGGRISWGVFLARANYPDLVEATAALTADEGETRHAVGLTSNRRRFISTR